MSLNYLDINSNIRSYKAYFQSSHSFLKNLFAIPDNIIVVDENVWNLHKNTTFSILKNTDIVVLPVDESRKSLDTVQKLYDKIMQRVPKKNMVIIAIGGGIVQDIVGFTASTLYRGVSWIFLPTTLLSQSDSCIGAKTSLNYKTYKNLIGTFYPPKEIYIYPEFLSTLKETDYLSGVGEMAKLHIIGGEKLTQNFIKLLPNILEKEYKIVTDVVRKSLLIKKDYIENDEFDLGKRNMLNFGHCFGHAIESATNFNIPHGLAVVIGIIVANIVSRKRGILSLDCEQFLFRQMLMPLLKIDLKGIVLDKSKIIEAMKQDKKRIGSQLALVMVNDNYEMTKVNNLSETEAFESLVEFSKMY